jgi:hypothetical protein
MGRHEPYDPFDLQLDHNYEPYTTARSDRPQRLDSTACGAVARTLTTHPKGHREIRMLMGAAVIGLGLAAVTAVTMLSLRPTLAEPTAAAAAVPVSTPASEPTPEAAAPAAAVEPDREPALVLEVLQPMPVVEVEWPEPPPPEWTADAHSDDELARYVEEDNAKLHAASGDDIIDLDGEEGDEDEEQDAEENETATARVAFGRFRSNSDSPSTSKKEKKKKKKKKKKKEAIAASEPIAAPTGPAGEFSRDAARSAMFAAASNASGCATKGGPSGRGKAQVMLSPSGVVSSVSVSAPFAGTKTGSCVAAIFRRVAIPPFTGGGVPLAKSFTIRAPASADDADTADDKPAKKKTAKKTSTKTKKKKKKKKASKKRKSSKTSSVIKKRKKKKRRR